MPFRLRTSMIAGLSLLSTYATLTAQTARQQALTFADKVRMVDCEPAANSPCFRLKLNAVDAQGAPAAFQLPPAAQLASAITVKIGNEEVTPFYAAGEATGSQRVLGRIALILVDISGSMNNRLGGGETRFAAAKVALSRFLDNFEDGVDQVAIVPFESHNVEWTIRNAQFAGGRQAAEQEVDLLPRPGRKNNTALYSSVMTGLEVLQQKAREKSGKALPEMSLIIMTDGKNEVYKGDDAGLLDGATGLETAASKVKDSGVQVIGVGFGDPADIDEVALRRISTTYYMAQDAAKLNTIFTFARTLLNNRITVTFSSPWSDRASLSGRVLPVSMRLKLPSGDTVTSNQQTWRSPEMGVPAFDEKCAIAEMTALLGVNRIPPGSDWMPILRPVLVFVGLGGLILVLWFWIPRLIWPERYMGMVPTTQRWMNTQMTKMGRGAPTGFRSSKAGPAPRAPSDATVVVPRTDFTKSRLKP